jgi:hypothetical protein
LFHTGRKHKRGKSEELWSTYRAYKQKDSPGLRNAISVIP